MRSSIKLAPLHLLVLALFIPAHVDAQESIQKTSPFGIAWRVIGAWRTAGSNTSVVDGDALEPGSLLESVKGGHDHSITVLLPDGQRILYECFTPRDCARGFRVPPLYRKPTSTEVDLLSRVSAVSMRSRDTHVAGKQEDSKGSRDEAVASIGPDNRVEVGGLAAALSDGTYSYEVRSVSHLSAQPARGSFEKRGKSIAIRVPSEGLFTVLIYDRLETLRIELLLAALRQPRAARVSKDFQNVEAVLKDWNEDYQGWPVHEFRRYYLRSVMLGFEPSNVRSRAPFSSAGKALAADVTCEPRFSPNPGVFKTDTEVTLQCSTAGATLRYTVDGSQPLDGASVYRAPIIVKGTALTIKAFATAEGKKDSPVVTGIFRIGD